MKLYKYIKSKPWLKKMLLWLLLPAGQARPRLWARIILIPILTKKGSGARISRYSRLDILPKNRFLIGNHSTIEDFTTINNGVGDVQIGNRTRIGISSVLIGPVNIGDDVRIAQNVVISGLNHNYEDISCPISEQGVTTKQVYIGDETWIGANATILSGVFIGKHCVIAAGSVVTRNIPSFSVAAGNPARIVKYFNPDSGNWERV